MFEFDSCPTTISGPDFLFMDWVTDGLSFFFFFFFHPLLVSVSDLCSHYLLIVLLFSVCVVVLAYIGGGGMEGNWVKGHRCSGARLVHDLVVLRQTLGGLSGEMFLVSLSLLSFRCFWVATCLSHVWSVCLVFFSLFSGCFCRSAQTEQSWSEG